MTAIRAPNGPNPSLLLLLLHLLPLLSLADGTELEALLSVRSSIDDDPLDSLSSWNSTTPFCTWRGVTCGGSVSSSSPHVSRIVLPGKNLTGGFPTSLFSLPFVDTIDLSFNRFSGEVPTGVLTPPASLRCLNLSSNNFSGTLRFGSDGWGNLEVLDLSNNYFSGEIPEQIRNFSRLRVLDLGGNSLQGRIPKSISDLRNLEFLTLASNELVGEIPPEIGRITTLRWIYLGYNNLSGGIPPDIGNLTAMDHLDLVYNNLTGEIPGSLGNLRRLRYLFVYMNKLSGPIPPTIYNLTDLISLDLSENSLSGEISDLVIRLQNLEVLHLFSNRVGGKIPGSINSLPLLQVLQLWSNGISGKIPRNLGLGNKLTVLDLSSNKLTGEIPEHLCFSRGLSKLILFSNSLRGRIPNSLGSCKTLHRIRLENNHLSGELPAEFTRMPLLYYLDLSGNDFFGRIDDRRWDMPALKMLKLARNRFDGNLPESFGSERLETLDLSENRFSGGIPSGIGRCSGLTQLRLSNNSLTGSLPEWITQCRKIVHVDVSKNQLSGQIPAGLSSLTVLSELDLSENQFSGEIPSDLGRIGSLVSVNISHNRFRGALPETGAFFAINTSAVTGNRALCGGNAGSGLPSCSKPPHWQFSVTALSAVLLLLSLSLLVLLLIRRRRTEELHVKRVDVENDNGNAVREMRIFDERVSNLATADSLLASVKEGNVISNGGRDAVWLAVRELPAAENPGFGWREVTALGRFRHRNVVGLLGACRSEGRWVFLFEFVEGRCLGGEGVIRELDWGRRWGVAVGVARGLFSLHRWCKLRGFYGSLSAEHVVLAGAPGGEEEPRLLLSVPLTTAASGCVRPEIREGKLAAEFTEKSDVYSFGVLIIQLLTGRRTTEADDGDVVGWARHYYDECHVDKWIDPALMRGHAANDDGEKGEIIRAMGLAVRCTTVDPADRPRMGDVLRHLTWIRAPRKGSWVSRVKNLKMLLLQLSS